MIKRFSDIPQFTKSPDVRSNVPLGRIKETVVHAIMDGLQLCPDFQRGHIWTETQQIRYVEYLLRGGKTGRDIYFNHPGWNSCESGDYVCVDGLQRLTTLLRFVNDEIRVFGSRYSEFEDNLRMTNYIIWHINDLQTKKEVLTWYLEMNEGGTPHTKEELDRVRKMIDNEKVES
jgi:uncharacterized protein with ParB-like and HNH nuclease domain